MQHIREGFVQVVMLVVRHMLVLVVVRPRNGSRNLRNATILRGRESSATIVVNVGTLRSQGSGK